MIEIYESTHKKILDSVGTYCAESGGVLACNQDSQIVDFFFDLDAGTGKKSYIPSQSAINHRVNQVWIPLGYHFGGVVHSHPEESSGNPSVPDIRMAERILQHNHLHEMYIIIVQKKTMLAWRVSLNNESKPQVTSCDTVILRSL